MLPGNWALMFRPIALLSMMAPFATERLAPEKKRSLQWPTIFRAAI